MIINMIGGLRLPRIFGTQTTKLDNCVDFVRQEVDKAIKSGQKEISVRSLFGGDNYDWCAHGFPIGDIWVECRKKYVSEGYSDPDEAAKIQSGKYVGMILKYVMYGHSKSFKMRKEFNYTTYTLV